VSGTATGVSITDGSTTSASITCLPTSPTALTLDTAATATLANAGEAWYSLTANASITYYFTQSNSNFAMALFDASGAKLASGIGYISYTPTVDQLLYLAAASIYNIPTETAKVFATTTATSASEGSTTNPITLTLDTTRSFKLDVGTGSSSYYVFTVGTDGYYGLDTSDNNIKYSAIFYSDSGFATSIGSNTSITNGYGQYFAAGTYYFKLTNITSTAAQIKGAVITQPTSDLNCEGTWDDQQQLSLGTSYTAKTGYHFYDNGDYFKFTTGTGTSYTITLNGVTPNPSGIWATVQDSSSATVYDTSGNDGIWADYVFSNSATYTLSANTTYIIRAWNCNSGASLYANGTFNILVTAN
jgi:hypothetical protein